MEPSLLDVITSEDAAVRDTPLERCCAGLGAEALLAQCRLLELFQRRSDNLYQRVRALFFLHAIHRFHLPRHLPPQPGLLPFAGHQHLLARRFLEAVAVFLLEQERAGPSDALCSALAAAYHGLGFQTLANQVRRSVRGVRGNQWMFRVGHPQDHPLRLREELRRRSGVDGAYPLLSERTPVRMDLSHSAWSDIFFLGMDYPEGARVLNISIDLGVRGRDAAPRPPIETSLRVLDEPVLRLVSVDLGARADLTSLPEVFDFAKDYLGLLKAAVIASGLVPPSLEGSSGSLKDLLARVVGPGLGLELVSNVNDIPKGSRLAVSTNLLGSLISLCMRATGQAEALTGPLRESERRTVGARAILGEWLGGSGGGWQDSGGVWPGIKLIEGALATAGDPELGISRGRLMPTHRLLGMEEVSAQARQKLQDSLVLVHGGMAQNVGPILEMVTEKYLERSEREWQGRQRARRILDDVLAALQAGDIEAIGRATTENFFGPLQTIIPWASNHYTERLIAEVRAHFGAGFWGFWMLGGMSGGGMGFIFAPEHKRAGQHFLAETMGRLRRELQHALPFAMEPTVYDFAINPHGTMARLEEGPAALMPPGYYAALVPSWLRMEPAALSAQTRAELGRFAAACRSRPEMAGLVQVLFDRLFPTLEVRHGAEETLEQLLAEYGFDPEQHERIRQDLRAARIGLARNRLPPDTLIEDVRPSDVVSALGPPAAEDVELGLRALAAGKVAVVSLAAGAGSRWTQGAGVVKALHPFCRFAGRHRTFVEVHLAKSRRTSRQCGTPLPHVVTTSYLTHAPMADFLAARRDAGQAGAPVLSPGKAVGLRLVPTARDLRYAWEELPQQVLDEQAQKVRQSAHEALIGWAQAAGEASDYRDNLPRQCLHPVGHWYELPNLLRNGVLAKLLAERPALEHLMLHNIDTLGADVDPGLLGLHLRQQGTLSFEVMTRRLEDRGGGLARVNGQVRLVEGLALPREEQEFLLSYYNTMTTWVHIDGLLRVFGLARAELGDAEKVAAAIRRVAARMPTYLTLKDVKKRWGHGQEDVYPVMQWEKLWSDMTALPEVDCRFFVVPRLRGQQLKDPAQLDGWLRDGSAAYVEALCQWE